MRNPRTCFYCAYGKRIVGNTWCCTHPVEMGKTVTNRRNCTHWKDVVKGTRDDGH